MPEIEIVADSHIEPTQTNEETLSETYAAFGLTPKAAKEQDDAEHDNEGKSVNETPAKEDVKAETKTHKFKHNKEDVEVDISTDEKLTDHLQRSLALDKERERKVELEKNLDRAAKLAGFKDHAEYAANLDRLEQQQQQKQQSDLDTMRKDLLDQLEANGIDRAQAEAYIENHPLIKQSKEAIQRDEERTKQEAEVKTKEQMNKAWQDLYTAYPDLVETSEAFNDGKEPEWFTADMKARILRGYDPKDAYELANRDKIVQKTTKAAEQKAIKDLQLGNRSAVETVPMGGQEPQASDELRNAFSMFGLDPKRANKYAKK